MKTDCPLKEFKTPRSFETWLSRHHAKAEGVRIKIAKKASGIPSITYAQALEVALCYGWIDGQSKSMDEQWFWQRFTHRRARSMWSKRNRVIVERLIEHGRMRPFGQAEIDRAMADGRWEAAYDSPASAKVPCRSVAGSSEPVSGRKNSSSTRCCRRPNRGSRDIAAEPRSLPLGKLVRREGIEPSTY
jgi:uncharacterized protein YdeI (YjbR/CyaY-like superfamily)